MSSTTALANAGVGAITNGKYAEGIRMLTEALQAHPAPLWHIERSKGYVRTSQFDLALVDAEMALRLSFDRANRNQMTEAQIRRSICLFRMGRFADADVCAFWAVRLAEGGRASDDVGQLNKVDENGDYTERAQEVQDSIKKPSIQEGLATAMGDAKQSKTTHLLNQAVSWRIQSLTQMENLPVGHEGRKIHLSSKYPELSQISAAASKTEQEPSPTAVSRDGITSESNTTTTPSTGSIGRDAFDKLWSHYQTMHSKHKIRCSFYQTETTMTIDIFLKNLTQEQITVDFKSSAIKISPNQGVSLGGLGGSILLLLAGEIKPEATKCTVKSMKIELVLHKQIPGKWPSFRREKTDIVDSLTLGPNQGVSFDSFVNFITALGFKDINELKLPDFDSDPSAWYAAFLERLHSKVEGSQVIDPPSLPKVEQPASSIQITPSPPKDAATKTESSEVKQAQATTATKSSAPSYPTSSKKGPTNWDKFDDAEDEENAADADVNTFFRSLYKGGNDDTRRAMMKSFIESNGTALSTNWDEAKEKTYETHAPDGAEAKEWK